MLRKFREFLEEDKQYFRSSESEITVQNNHMLIDGCVVYAAVLLFYTIITTITNQPVILRRMYYVFDVIHVIVCIAVFARPKIKRAEYSNTQFYCILLEITILGFFALEGVLTSKTEHSLYVPIAILLVLLLFIHKALYTNSITFVYVVFFASASYIYKTREAFANDLNIAVATFLAANIGYVLIAKMRHKEAAALCKFESLSKMDMLTSLLNKTAIERISEQILAIKDHECTFIILDLDDFKHVNDQYGHDVGDEVLKSVGQALEASFRGTDFIGRFGGDEFIVLMDQCTNKDIVVDRVKNIIGVIENLKFSKPQLRLRCSVGITMKREKDDFKSIFKRADQALYEVKEHGKGGYRISD